VLTSARTFSGGEEFANNMKALGRGILAHPGTRFPLDANFEMFIPVGRAENPIAKSNWEGTGVLPDVAVPAGDAVERALANIGATARLPRRCFP
jgi:C-terminal processing protease CtpA/Prc